MIVNNNINDDIKYNVIAGDVVLIHESNWNYTKRMGHPYLAIVIYQDDTSGQPLCVKYSDIARGVYSPFWTTYYDIISIIDNVNLCYLLRNNLVNPLKNKDYYISKFDKKWKEYLIKTGNVNSDDNEQATNLFDETASAEEVVGFYLKFHKDNAYEEWLTNIDGINLSDQDTTVDFILKYYERNTK